MTQYLVYDTLERLPWMEKNKAQETLRIKLESDVKLLSNNKLFEDFSELSGGDDWDGEFTPGGSVAMEVLDTELRFRLISCGFLTDSK